MGFGNATYRDTINSLTQGQIGRLANPYYKWTNKRPTKVTYWNINNKHTTLDAGKKDTYDQLGNKSPLRYNRIKDFILYGLPRFEANLELQEYGVEGSEIGGEALILPNTIIPSTEDMFTIDYINKPYLFRITKQSIDNIEVPGGHNFYKCTFVLDNTRQDWLDSLNGRQLVKKFKFKIENVGTNATPILTEEENEAIGALQALFDTLRQYYIELFWRPNVQTFICGYLDGQFFYDPYLIEFMIRNSLFSSSDETKYLFVDQAVHTSSTFILEYNRTIFKDIEDRNSQMHTNSAYLVPVHDPNSLLMDRMEDYFQLSINLHHKNGSNPVNQINNNLFDHIQENTPFDEENDVNHVLYWNIIVNFMNQSSSDFSITEAELNSIDRIKYKYCKDLFYEIPILMYIIQAYMVDLQKTVESTDVESDANIYLENCYNVRK